MGRFSSELLSLRKHFAQNDRIREMSVHSLKVHCVTWNQDGRRLASGSLDKSVSIFSLDKDRLVSSWLAVLLVQATTFGPRYI